MPRESICYSTPKLATRQARIARPTLRAARPRHPDAIAMRQAVIATADTGRAVTFPSALEWARARVYCAQHVRRHAPDYRIRCQRAGLTVWAEYRSPPDQILPIPPGGTAFELAYLARGAAVLRLERVSHPAPAGKKRATGTAVFETAYTGQALTFASLPDWARMRAYCVRRAKRAGEPYKVRADRAALALWATLK